jgi:hypothetical protein
MKVGYVKKDEYASIFIRALTLISSYLGTMVHTSHTPRRSNWETEIADNFTHRSTTSFLETQVLNRFNSLKVPEILLNWLKDPSDDWSVATKLLSHVMSLCEQ